MGVIFRNGKPYGGAASSTDEIYYIDDNGNRITLTEEIEVLKQSCQYDLDSKIDKTEKGSKNGVAELDGTGKVPSDQLPSYVDDVIEGYYNSNDENFYLDEEYTENIKGEEGKIYIDLITNGSYRYAIKSNKFIKITSGYIGGKTDYGTIIIDGNSILLDQAVGMSTENHEYEIDGEVISSKNGAEIFNDYQHNIASGDYSHAEGSETIASGPYSHAEGSNTVASGNSSHSEGYGNTASGHNSHAEGTAGIASGLCSHAEGANCKAIGDYSHAEGASSQSTGLNSHSENSSFSIGDLSHSEGNGSKAIGRSSHAQGTGTHSYGENSNSEGYQTTAFGDTSHIEGYSSHICDNVIEITDSTTDEEIQTAWLSNKFSFARGSASHAEGIDCLALGKYSHAEGRESKALGEYSHSEGVATVANTHGAHAEGTATTASGTSSHAEGNVTIASGTSSHAEGHDTVASATCSHAEGQNTSALGTESHAEGFGTKASGHCSHSEGIHTIASSDYQHVQGKYNVEDTESKYAFIIGNGTSNDNRSNAIAIDWDGNIICYGDEISINEQIDNNTRKLSGIDDNANNYIHPTHTSHSKSMYKFANDELGHISDAEPVTKDDIVELGIPGQDTTYTLKIAYDVGIQNSIALVGNDGSIIYVYFDCFDGLIKATSTSDGIQREILNLGKIRKSISLPATMINKYDESRGYCITVVGLSYQCKWVGNSNGSDGSMFEPGTELKMHVRNGKTGTDFYITGTIRTYLLTSGIKMEDIISDLHISTCEGNTSEKCSVYAWANCNQSSVNFSNNYNCTVYIAIYSSAESSLGFAYCNLLYTGYNNGIFGSSVDISTFDSLYDFDRSKLIKQKPDYDVATSLKDGLMSIEDKIKLDNITDNANNYVHPTTSGNKHIPSGGSSGQILRWSKDGTAVWGKENDTEIESISNIDLENMLK